MPSKTPNYNLWLYAANETVERFFDFRVNIAGTQQTANFVIIDGALKTLSDSIAQLQQEPSAFYIEAEYVAEGFYSGYDPNYKEPTTGQMIILSLNKTNAESVSIQIGTFQTVSVMKVNSAGELVNLEPSDMIANKPVLCVYNATAYVAIGLQSANDIHINGTPGQILAVSNNNTIQALSAELNKANGIATLDENGKLVQVANVADKATLAETAEAVKTGSIVTDSFAADAVAPEAGKVTNPLVIQLGDSDEIDTTTGNTKKTVYMYDGEEHIDVIITPESIGVKNTSVYVYRISLKAANWALDATTNTYYLVVNCENITENTELSDITLASSDVGNEMAETAATQWTYLETGNGTITFHAGDIAPTSDFNLIARELKGDEFTSQDVAPPTPTNPPSTDEGGGTNEGGGESGGETTGGETGGGGIVPEPTDPEIPEPVDPGEDIPL